jgi:transcriptional regulator with XRE-family HTH domain
MIKDRIRELRDKNQLSMKAFAESIGVSGTSCSLYESGKQNPGKKTIDKICEVYKVSKEWLLDEVGDLEKAAEPVVEKTVSAAKTTSAKVKEAASPVVEKAVKSAEPVVEKAIKSAEPVVEKAVKSAEPVVEKAVKAAEPVKEKAEAAVKKAVGKRAKKTETVPLVVVESQLGGQISVDEILRRVNEQVSDASHIEVYVKAEENKAYYTSDAGEGSIDLW